MICGDSESNGGAVDAACRGARRRRRADGRQGLRGRGAAVLGALERSAAAL